MKGINHVVGGAVFTGIFASFWNVNIFSSVEYFGFSVFCSLLPDIDHSKSIIGKMFYPIARFLDRNFGHRTITHSLLFLTVICLITAFIEHLLSDEYNFTLICFFSIFSHFILDLVTIQGIPLFYPFFRNPCVIFGNPAYRLKTNNWRSELVALAIFILIGVSCVGLFKNGFWTSYNRTFGTLKHIHQENINSDKLVKVDYSFIRDNKEYSGQGILINSQETKAIIYDSTLFTLDKNDELVKINFVKPLKTHIPKIIKETSFFSITYDSLVKVLQNKIFSGSIQSSEPVMYFENNIKKISNIVKFENVLNPEILFVPDTSLENNRNKLTLKLEQLKENQEKWEQKRTDIQTLKHKRDIAKKQLKNAPGSYEINKLKEQIISLQTDIDNKQQSLHDYIPDKVLLKEIELLQQEVNTVKEVLFSGVVRYLVL